MVNYLIQSNFGTEGNFEVVRSIRGNLQHSYRDNDNSELLWNPTDTFASGVTNPDESALIQSRFGRKGNFVVVVPVGGSQGGLQYWYRDNDDPSQPWVPGQTFVSGVNEGPTLIQSNLGPRGNNFEVVVPIGNSLQYWFRNNGDPSFWV
jgi:hypothetical protein